MSSEQAILEARQEDPRMTYAETKVARPPTPQEET
eukprot:CAMPEP_0172634298 /NCGR_PEP_ID=MMETSP1068-20121228/193779_1 /TAXON_ID=35684 /ORGANISM="Pseudopedinella elastica, Strain CCMP716" /LENGTH=34 /DNA_ID= /DNA_START= /DNA_END= /DNA_ORIENTATION=